MDPTDISLLVLRHLAKEGCKDTIKVYMNECSSVKHYSELFHQKLVNPSLTLSLAELLHEYARAKSIIQDLVSKLLYDWKTLSTLFVSPHDSIATQLAHISQLLETKCKRVPMETKCVGTSDDIDMMMHVDSSIIATSLKVDAEVQTGADDQGQGEVGDAEDLPNIVESLLAPQNLDKMVEIANRELNRSSQSANEAALANDTEVDINQMLLEILHGSCPDANIPTTALNEGLHRSQVVPCASTSGAQLLEIFQDVQNVIADTPITGTLGNPEYSVSKQPKHYTSCLDLIETPCKYAFAPLMTTTPLPKTTTFDPEPPEKLANLKTVALDFGPAVNSHEASAGSVPDPVQEQIALTRIRQHNGPRYSVVQQESCCGRVEIDRLRKKRDITPRIPVTSKPENDGQCSTVNDGRCSTVNNGQCSAVNDGSSSTVALLRSASKRKFTTPVKISPGKALMTSVNFYCPSTSLHEKSTASKEPEAVETPHKEAGSVCESEQVPVVAPSPLATINYKDLFDASVSKHIVTPKPQVSFKDQKNEPPSDPPQPDDPSQNSNTNMTTPDNRKESEETLTSHSPHMYNRLLASVRQTRPVTIVNKKSYSTPRKKGHIRNLLFKTPPGTQQQDKFKLSNVEEEGSLKRKLSPPLGNKSKKRLKWTNLVKNSEQDKCARSPPKVTYELPKVTYEPPKVTYEPISPVAPSAPVSNHPTPPNFNQVVHPVSNVNQVAHQVSNQNQVVHQVSNLNQATHQVSNLNQVNQARPCEPLAISMTEVASKVLTQTRTRSTNQSKKTVQQDGANKSDKCVLEICDVAKMSFQTPAPSNRRRRSKRMEDLMAAEAAVNAVPLGPNSNQQQQRFARKTRSATKNSPELSRTPEVPAGPSIVEPARSPVKDSPVTRSSPSKSVPNIQLVKQSQQVKPKKESRAIFHPRTRQAKATALQSLAQSLEINRQGPLNPPRQQEVPRPEEGPLNPSTSPQQVPRPEEGPLNPSPRPQQVPRPQENPVSSTIPQQVPSTSTRLASIQLAKAFPHWSASLEQSSKEQSDTGKSSTDSSTASTSSGSLGNSWLKSPGWDGGKSPLKTPHKNTPRRILPKPVPPDHPVPPVFPPPLPTTSYVLSIPSSDTPSKDKSDIFKSVTVESLPPQVDKFPQLSCSSSSSNSSSDSSAEISVTSPVPMTPRLKPDPGEESSMHTRLFPDSSASGLGAPIFSSTPLKFPSIPATPGKNILNTIMNKPLNESGECSQGSLFDTPLKVSLPPPPPPPVMVKVSVMKTPPRPAVRKSPRKVTTPVKKQKVTLPKKLTPPKKFKSPSTKSSKKVPRVTLKNSPVGEERKDSGGSTLPKKSQQVPQVDNKTNFLSVCTKSKSFMRLAQIAQRGRASATPAPAPVPDKIPSVQEKLDPPTLPDKEKDSGLTKDKDSGLMKDKDSGLTKEKDSGLMKDNDSGLTKEKDSGLAKDKDSGLTKEKDAGLVKGKEVSIAKENNLESNKNKKGPEAHFQFSVSGRAKQLSLSEHETLLGLLQMSSVNAQPVQPPPPQKPEVNVLSGIDLFQFLKKVHRAD